MSRSTAGFTLLEMALASAIFAIVIFTAFTGLYTVQSSWERAHIKNDRLEKLLTIDRVIDSAFRNAIPFNWTDTTTGNTQEIFVGDRDSTCFAYGHRIGHSADGAIRFIKLFQEGSELVAEFRQTPIVPWDTDNTGISREVLATGVSSVSFLYAERVSSFNSERIEWLEDWDEEKNTNLPLAIQITVEWESGEVYRWLRRTAGSGMFECLGKRDSQVDDEASATE